MPSKSPARTTFHEPSMESSVLVEEEEEFERKEGREGKKDEDEDVDEDDDCGENVIGC